MAKDFNPMDWSAAVGGVQLPWTTIEVTLEQFHVPARFAIAAPLQAIDIPNTLADKSPEVVIKYRGTDFFVGQLDDSKATGKAGNAPGEQPEDILTLTGRDKSAKLVLTPVLTTPPTNKTASEIVTTWCKAAGFTDTSGITPTSEQVGDFIKHNYTHITSRLNQHDIIFTLAELSNFVFRIHNRSPFFGPQPDPSTIPNASRPLKYQADFNMYEWGKSHTNSDVTVKVMGGTAKKRIAQVAGSGTLVVQRYDRTITTVSQAKALANKILMAYERGLKTIHVTDVPGDPSLNDILFAFRVSGIAKGVDGGYFPSKIHHVITQDDHVMDLEHYNAIQILK
jgi:hypothetical protein